MASPDKKDVLQLLKPFRGGTSTRILKIMSRGVLCHPTPRGQKRKKPKVLYFDAPRSPCTGRRFLVRHVSSGLLLKQTWHLRSISEDLVAFGQIQSSNIAR